MNIWPMMSSGQVAVGAGARDEQAGGERNQERRHLRHQPVADRELGEDLAGLAERHPLLEHRRCTMPPTILISVMTMLAIASPRTNLLAPSIAP